MRRIRPLGGNKLASTLKVCQKVSLTDAKKCQPPNFTHCDAGKTRTSQWVFDKEAKKQSGLSQREAVSRYSVDAAAGTEHFVSGADSLSGIWRMVPNERLASSNLLPDRHEHNNVTRQAPHGTAGDAQKILGEYRRAKIHASVSPNPTISGTIPSLHARLATASAIAIIISANGTATIRSTK